MWVMCRQVERVHAAVLGAHERHACLPPLEMYLEEGIPLVCYVRDQGHAQMVELPEQSCHAFLSFSNAAASPPCIKVSSQTQFICYPFQYCSHSFQINRLLGSITV